MRPGKSKGSHASEALRRTELLPLPRARRVLDPERISAMRYQGGGRVWADHSRFWRPAEALCVLVACGRAAGLASAEGMQTQVWCSRLFVTSRASPCGLDALTSFAQYLLFRSGSNLC